MLGRESLTLSQGLTVELFELGGEVAACRLCRDEIGRVPHKSALQHHCEAAWNALDDAGLDKREVDGLFTARYSPLTTGEYMGIRPRYTDGTWIGGGSFESHVMHAMAAIRAGFCEVALITHGQTGRSASNAVANSSSMWRRVRSSFARRSSPFFAPRTSMHLHRSGPART